MCIRTDYRYTRTRTHRGATRSAQRTPPAQALQTRGTLQLLEMESDRGAFAGFAVDRQTRTWRPPAMGAPGPQTLIYHPPKGFLSWDSAGLG